MFDKSFWVAPNEGPLRWDENSFVNDVGCADGMMMMMGG